MMLKLKGRPLSNKDGERSNCTINGPRSWAEFVYIAMSALPTRSVLRHVSANNATFNQGNFCSGARSNRISAGESNELLMKHLTSVSPGVPAAVDRFTVCVRRQWQVPRRGVRLLLERLQVFAGLEANGLTGRDVHFRSRPRIPADAGFPRFYREYAE